MFLYFLLLSGFCVPTCTSRLQFYKPTGFQVPNLITSFFIQHYRRRHQKNGARNRWRAAPFTAARRMACQLAVEFLQWFHFRRVIVRSTPLPFFWLLDVSLKKTIRKTCMLSCWGNIVCDICFRFSSVALLSWLVGQIMMLPYHYRHNWQLVPPVFVLNGIFWNAWMLEKKWKQKHCLDTMGQNMMLKGLTVRLAFFRRPFLNVANSKINRPFVCFFTTHLRWFWGWFNHWVYHILQYYWSTWLKTMPSGYLT